jgi:hypothetical protein
MPSTYTTNLGIELPADGELDGVWGDVVNENMDILDRAINGSIALSLSGTSSTLTTSDGALSDGQYKLLVLGGTPSGTHTITISPNDAQKIYFVRNTTAQSVVFTQGSGGNVTIATGDSAIIYSDGAGASAAVVNITNDFAMSSVKITGGTIDGTVIGGSSAAAGTFTTATATTGNITTVNATTVDTTNIEVTTLKAKDGTSAGSIADSTGVVTLASSVLTTTDINGGTVDGAVIGGASAAAGTFTTATATTGNITTVNATTVDTTNIEVTTIKAKDGTSAGSIADSTGVVTLASSVLTTTDINGGTIDGAVIGGSSAAAITGTTITATGDLTIADKIVHAGDTNTAIRFPAADTVTVETSGTERLRIDSSGNVGIGTTSPSVPLQVVGDITFGSATVSAASYTLILFNGTSDTTIFRRYSNSGAEIRHTGGPFATVTQGADPLIFSTTATERMRILSGGNVGIGTTNPATTLDVNGDVTITDKIIHSGDTNTAIRFPAADTVTVETAGTERLRVTSTGFVGLGTSNPRSGIHVFGAGQTTANITDAGDQAAFLRVSQSSTAAGSGGGVIFASTQSDGANAVGMAAIKGILSNGSGNTTGDLAFSTRNATTDTALAERMRITSTGNVGIGTTSPAQALSVNGSIDILGSTTETRQLQIGFGRTGDGLSLIDFISDATYTDFGMRISRAAGENGTAFINVRGTGGITLNTADAAPIQFITTATERMRITAAGNVGIGTSSPDAPLHLANGTSANFILEDSGAATNNAAQGKVEFQRSADVAFGGLYITDGTVDLNISTKFPTGFLSFGTDTGTERMRITAAGNVLIGGTATPASAAASLAIFNGTAPTGSVTNGVVLYAEDVSSSSELKVRDEAGNVTTLSPHNFDLIPEGPSEDMAWSYYSERDGKRINVDMLKAIRLLESITGEKLVHIV